MQDTEFNPYLSQLEQRAAELGLGLTEVCVAEGVAETTLFRWRKGETTCRQGTAEALFRRMEAMSAPAQEPA
jgi:hypothetical protein|tara:strand:- start:1529 stop:1744 length:216 start_codon:yes stop_codon:yes gene_type:complete